MTAVTFTPVFIGKNTLKIVFDYDACEDEDSIIVHVVGGPIKNGEYAVNFSLYRDVDQPHWYIQNYENGFNGYFDAFPFTHVDSMIGAMGDCMESPLATDKLRRQTEMLAEELHQRITQRASRLNLVMVEAIVEWLQTFSEQVHFPLPPGWYR